MMRVEFAFVASSQLCHYGWGTYPTHKIKQVLLIKYVSIRKCVSPNTEMRSTPEPVLLNLISQPFESLAT